MRAGSEFGEALRVDVEGALQGEDADVRNVDHPLRVAASALGARGYSCQPSAGLRIVSRGRKTTDVDVVCCSGLCDFSVVGDGWGRVEAVLSQSDGSICRAVLSVAAGKCVRALSSALRAATHLRLGIPR